MLQAVKNLHEMGKVHLDIKPDNFRVTKNHIVKLLDYGNAMDYFIDGKHKNFCVCNFQGSPFYASLNAHNEYSLSRRDDLESLGYCILNICFPQLIKWKENYSKEQIK